MQTKLISSQALRAAVWCHRFSMRELVLPWSLGSLLLLGVAAIGWLELLDVPALEPHHDPWKGNSSINHQLENKARWAIPNYSRIWYAR